MKADNGAYSYIRSHHYITIVGSWHARWYKLGNLDGRLRSAVTSLWDGLRLAPWEKDCKTEIGLQEGHGVCSREQRPWESRVGQREEVRCAVMQAQGPQSIPGGALDLQLSGLETGARSLYPCTDCHWAWVTSGRRCDLARQLSQTGQFPERDLAICSWPPSPLVEWGRSDSGLKLETGHHRTPWRKSQQHPSLPGASN